MTYSGFDKKGVLVSNKSVVNDTEHNKAPLNPHHRNFLERFIILEPGQRVGINEVEILALKTKHSDPSAIGFKFFTPNFTLSYSSDTKYFPELIEEYKNSNILILNVPYLKKEDAKENLCIEDAIKIINGVKPRLAIIQHFGIDMLKADPLYQIREIQKATEVQTIAAKDGMVINPLSYSVDQGQRTLHFNPADKKIEIKEEKTPEYEQEPESKEEQQPQEQIQKEPEPIQESPQIVKEAIQKQKEERPTQEQTPNPPNTNNAPTQETTKTEDSTQSNILDSQKPIKEILKEDLLAKQQNNQQNTQ